MKYKIDLKYTDYNELYRTKQLELLLASRGSGISVSHDKHKPTGVIIKYKDTNLEIDYLYAESDSSEAMNNFKDYLKIIGID